MTEESREIKDRFTLQEMIQVMKSYIELPTEFDYYIALEFSILSRLRGHIPNDLCCYLLIHGPSGTGKSHAGQFITEISRGDWLQAISEGALLAGVSSGNLIGIDEIDGQAKRIEATEDILRIGHIWDAKYRKMVPDNGVFKPQEIACGGPKILTSISLPEEALASRCYSIQMSRSSKTNEFSVRWPYRKDDVIKVAKSLDLYANDIKKNLDGDKLQEWQYSQEHLAELSLLSEVHSRRTDLANLFTTIDYLLEWNVKGIIEAMAKENMDEEKEAIRTYLRELEEIERRNTADVENDGIRASRVLEFINQRRREAGLRPFTPRLLGKNLIELGFTEQINKIRRSDGIHYLFNETTHKILSKGVMTWNQSQLVDAQNAEQVGESTSK